MDIKIQVLEENICCCLYMWHTTTPAKRTVLYGCIYDGLSQDLQHRHN